MGQSYLESLPDPDDRWALFLDVDGTLIEIADTPNRVRVEPRVNEILLGLDRRFGHAVALVSGRSIEQLDHLFAPLRHTVAGLHGLERRGPGGEIKQADCTTAGMDRIRASFAQFTDTHPQAIMEDKGLSVALHFRRAPNLAAKVGLVTPLRDGMNLVAKEYVAAQDPDNPGVLVLSRFAGAAHELESALRVNPYDTDEVANAMNQALEMPLGERKERHGEMLDGLLKNNVHDWRRKFLAALQDSQRQDA